MVRSTCQEKVTLSITEVNPPRLTTYTGSLVAVQKWSKGKMKEKVNNQVLFDKVQPAAGLPIRFWWGALTQHCGGARGNRTLEEQDKLSLSAMQRQLGAVMAGADVCEWHGKDQIAGGGTSPEPKQQFWGMQPC